MLSVPSLQSSIREESTPEEISETESAAAGSRATSVITESKRKRISGSSVKSAGKTVFHLAHPPPISIHKQNLHIRPRVLLQLQKISETARPIPVLEVLPSFVFASRLARRFPRTFKGKAGLGADDLVVVSSDDYRKDGADNGELDGIFEGDRWDKREIMAAICQSAKDGIESKGRAEICLSSGPSWTAYRLANGAYEFASVDEHGLRTIARWVPRQAKVGQKISTTGRDRSVSEEKKFSFSLLNPNLRRHAIIASLDRQSIEVCPKYTNPPLLRREDSSSTSVTPSSRVEEPTPKESIEVSPALRSLIIITGIFVSFQEGFSSLFRPSDSAPNSPQLGSKHQRRALSMNGFQSGNEQISNPPSPKFGDMHRSRSILKHTNSTSAVPFATNSGQMEPPSRRATSSSGSFMQRVRSRNSTAVKANQMSPFSDSDMDSRLTNKSDDQASRASSLYSEVTSPELDDVHRLETVHSTGLDIVKEDAVMAPTGFEDLMGSLQSPGLTGPMAPFQPGFSQWPNHWQQSTPQANPQFSATQQMLPPNHMAWSQNTQNGYIGFDQGEDDELFTVDDTDILNGNGQQHSISNGRKSSQSTPGVKNPQYPLPRPIPNLSSSSPLTLPPSQIGVPQPKSPMVSAAATTARAAELRAKLLASKNSKSRQGSPAVKSKELSNAKETHPVGTLKQPNAILTQAPKQKDTATPEQTSASSATPAVKSSDTNASTLDNFLAAARDAADAHQKEIPSTNRIETERADSTKRTEATPDRAEKPNLVSHEGQVSMVRNRSTSDVSEPGEIRSNAGTPPPTDKPQLQSQTSRSSEPSRATKDNQDKEKLARQNEVQKAYQTLKTQQPKKSEPKSSQPKSITTAKAVESPQPSRRPSFERRDSALYRPPMRRGSSGDRRLERQEGYFDIWRVDRGARRSSGNKPWPHASDSWRDDEARRQKPSEEAPRRGSDHRKSLDAQKTPLQHAKSVRESRRNESPEETLENLSRKNSMNSNVPVNTSPRFNDSEKTDRNDDNVMLSLQVQDNDDINDWLELTEFYDDEIRERRLKIFRKRKALDIQLAELEREQELELQQSLQRSHRNRSQSVLQTNRPTSTQQSRAASANLRMPPPPLPLPLRETDKETGTRIKSTASSAGLSASSQLPSPALKRQYAEDDTELPKPPANSIDSKRARLDKTYPSLFSSADDRGPLYSPVSVREEPRPAPALENRISRRGSWAPRPRSRSPDYRRRSLSPRDRRGHHYSPPSAFGLTGGTTRGRGGTSTRGRDHYNPTCYNCGRAGHKNVDCPHPTTRGYEQWVPSCYRGKNSVGKLAALSAKGNANNNDRARKASK
ncbi:hypothetical protein ACLMJK_005483 [Lecanora helva]